MNDLDLLRAAGPEYARSGPKLVRVANAQPGLELRPFELKEDLLPGGYAAAYRLDENGEPITEIIADPLAYPPVEARAEDVFEVVDAWACYRGRARVEHVDADPEAEPPVEEVAGQGGSRGVARKDAAGEWVIDYLEPNALIIRGQVVKDVVGSSASFEIDNVAIVSPTGALIVDQAPPHEPADTMDVYDPAEKDRTAGDTVDCQWNEDAQRWEVLPGEGEESGVVKWALWNANSNGSGATPQTFSVKACKYDGTAATGDPFNVKTPIKIGADTALFAGNVVGYQEETDGTKVVVTDCWDDPIGTVRMVTAATAIRNGWTEIEGIRNKFPRGWDNEATRKTGGSNIHASSDVAGVLADHTVDIEETVVTGHLIYACIADDSPPCIQIAESGHAAHDHAGTVSAHAGAQAEGEDLELDNVPEYYTFIFIERTS